MEKSFIVYDFLLSEIYFYMRRYTHVLRYERLCLRTAKKRVYQWKFRVWQEPILLRKNWIFTKKCCFHALKIRAQLVKAWIHSSNHLYHAYIDQLALIHTVKKTKQKLC